MHIEIGAGAYSTSLVFDSGTSAAEVTLVGGDGGTVISPAQGDGQRRLSLGAGEQRSAHHRVLELGGDLNAILRIEAGAPRINLIGLHFRGAVNGPAIAMSGGSIHMDNCTLTQSVGGLVVRGGSATMRGGAIKDNNAVDGGGVHVTGGTLQIERTLLQSNSASEGGGAMRVSGGQVVVSGAQLIGNSATSANGTGGALYVSGGSVSLTDKTVMTGNDATTAHTIRLVAPGALSYTLPSPLGRWVAEDDVTQESIDEDFPYECFPGFRGDSNETSKQRSQRCAGLCEYRRLEPRRPCP